MVEFLWSDQPGGSRVSQKWLVCERVSYRIGWCHRDTQTNYSALVQFVTTPVDIIIRRTYVFLQFTHRRCSVHPKGSAVSGAVVANAARLQVLRLIFIHVTLDILEMMVALLLLVSV